MTMTVTEARIPAPASDTPCFGVSFLRDDPECLQCSLRKACRAFRGLEYQRLSLSRLEQQQEQEELEETPRQTYIRAYNATFGKRPYIQNQIDKFLARVQAHCLVEGASFQVYVEAQMYWYHRRSPDGDFPLGQLSPGPSARGDYNAYLRAAHRRYRRAESGTMIREGAEGLVRQELLVSEQEIGEAWLHNTIADGPQTWKEVLDGCFVSESWHLASRGESPETVDWRPEHCVREIRRARISAAIGVASSVRAGLADRISVAPDFTWSTLVDYLVQMIPAPVSRPFNDADCWVPGATL